MKCLLFTLVHVAVKSHPGLMLGVSRNGYRVRRWPATAAWVNQNTPESIHPKVVLRSSEAPLPPACFIYLLKTFNEDNFP